LTINDPNKNMALMRMYCYTYRSFKLSLGNGNAEEYCKKNSIRGLHN
jgi:hypothetical protein